MKKVIAIVAAVVSFSVASEINVNKIDNNLGSIQRVWVDQNDDSLFVAGKITIRRGLDKRHVEITQSDSEGSEIQRSCHSFYIPGDDHVHLGVSKRGTFSAEASLGNGVESISIELVSSDSCSVQ